MRIQLAALVTFVRARLRSRATVALENAALRQQLAAYHRIKKRPQLRPGDRLFWIVLRWIWSDWVRSLVLVQPATVIGWHRRGFRALWRNKSKPGRSFSW